MAISCIDNMESKLSQPQPEMAWAALKQIGPGYNQPFQLALMDSKDVLCCNKILRVIPGKRIVALANWGGKTVIAKLFFEKGRAIHHAKRDAEGIKALLTAGVLTPALYYQGSAVDKHVQVLIFENIANSLSLDDAWRLKSNIAEITPVMCAVTIELATQHVLGVTQNDLHFRNFLIRKKNIYTLDGGDVSIIQEPLPKKESVENLGLFFAQMGVGTEELQEKLFEVYAKSRGWLVKKQDMAGLKAALEKFTNKRWDDYSEKIMRNCTAFVRHATPSKLTIYDRDYESPEFLQALKNPEIVLAAQTSEILKGGRSSTVAEVLIDNRAMVIKRYNMKNFSHQLRRSLRTTRAAKNWRLAQLLRLVGIPIVKPLAFVEKRFLGLRGKSYLFMEYVDGIHAGEFFANPDQDSVVSLVVAKEIVLMIENLAKLRITHGDLKMTNILIAKQKPVLIDLDGMTEHTSSIGFKRAFNQEIKRFMQNWGHLPVIYKMFELLIEEMQINIY